MTDNIPRLALEKCTPEIQDMLRPVVDRLGYFGEFFQVAGHLPAALQEFMAYTGAVKSPLDLRQNEVLALSTCAEAGGDYERIQHERLALNSGLDPNWIAEVIGKHTPTPSLLSAEDKALRDLAIATVQRDGRDVGAEISIVAELLGPEKAMAVVFQITRFQMISTLTKMFEMSLPVTSIFDEKGPV
jgi:alkylhydroperoxidase family enzyme